ncbi:MAG: DUF2934 domain-containing protein [Gallionella sp.]|nr:DUF2934 domain-containing protein [Gallionella sp.]
MAEQKTSSDKTGSVVAVKPKTTKVAASAAAKKVAAKKDPAPAVKKAPAPAANKKVPVKKASVKKAATAGTKPAAKKTAAKPASEERYRMVQTAAYFIAELNGFGGCATDHWATAEIEIANLLGQ